MTVLEILKQVQDAAEREASGDPSAHFDLVTSIQKLQIAATTPTEKMVRLRFQVFQNACVRIAQECGILQALAASSDSKSAKELSEATQADELLIVRIMRLITVIGIADEVGPSQYKANETTKHSIQKGIKGDVKFYTDIVMRVCSSVGPMASASELYQFPEADQLDPHAYTFGAQMFPYQNQHPEYGQAFADFMTARRAATWSKWFDIYPAAAQWLASTAPALKRNDPAAVLLVDVAGGQGYWTQQFQHTRDSAALPGRLVVQDQPSVVATANLDGVEAMAYDFLTPQPIKGARAYYFKQIMHDWPDSTCRTILGHTVAAMEKGYSTLLINDFVLPERDVGFRAASMDIAMMLLSSGLERTETQWRHLLDSVGVRIVKIWTVGDIHEGNEAVIECEKI